MSNLTRENSDLNSVLQKNNDRRLEMECFFKNVNISARPVV